MVGYLVLKGKPILLKNYFKVTVEPFYENILRLHKASKIEKFHKRITLIQNALSNKRNEIKLLTSNPSNIGGQR